MSIPRATRSTRHGLWAVVVVATLSGLAAAQPPPGPAIRPTVSPYLNLLQGNNSPAANYYGVIRPVQDLRRQSSQLSNQFNSLQGQVNEAAAGSADLPATGHAAGFLNAGSYFLNVGVGTSGLNPTPVGGVLTAPGGAATTGVLRPPTRR